MFNRLNEEMEKRKRMRMGNSTLTEQDVRDIRRRLARGESNPRMEARFHGVGLETIKRIERRDTWDWLKDEVNPLAQEEEKKMLQESASRMFAMQEAIAAEKAQGAKADAMVQEMTELEKAAAALGVKVRKPVVPIVLPIMKEDPYETE